MSEIEAIICELKNIHNGNAWHGASLADTIKGIAYEQASARPIKNAHNIWEIVAHIEGWEDVFLRRLEGEVVSEPEAGDFPLPDQPSEILWMEMLEKLEKTHHRLLRVVEKLPVSILETKIVGKDYSYRFLLRETINHKVYHSGQIALLKKEFI